MAGPSFFSQPTRPTVKGRATHVTMAVNNCDYYEVFPANGANKFALVADIEVDDQGLVYAPEQPGLGYEIDWELVKRETVQVVK